MAMALSLLILAASERSAQREVSNTLGASAVVAVVVVVVVVVVEGHMAWGLRVGLACALGRRVVVEGMWWRVCGGG